MHNSIN